MLTRLRRRLAGRDHGFTLVELLVAMGLFSLLLVMFMAGVVGMSRLTVRANNTADDADAARKAYQTLDSQVRSAAALNQASVLGGSWYVEMLATPGRAGAPPYCVQWRLEGATRTLAYRTYPDTTQPTPSAWHPVAFSVVVPPATGTAPLQMLPADATHRRQRLAVHLTVQNGSTRPSQVDTVLVARNTSATTRTNSLQAGDQVCTQVERR